MDDTFRLVFANPEKTPLAEAYLAPDALVFDRLYDAVKLAGELNFVWGVPFIAHRFRVLEPTLIELLYKELVSPKSCGSTPDSPC